MRRAAASALLTARARLAPGGAAATAAAAAPSQWCLPPSLCAARRPQQQRRALSGGGAQALDLQLMDAIHLRGLMFHGYHGVLPEETRLGQKFLVDATLYCGRGGLLTAGCSDDLANSVNYAAVYEDISKARGLFVMEGEPFKLLEAAAHAICERVLAEQQRVAAVRVHVRKPHVALRGPLDSVGVEILRSRMG
ncbi:dihydroneopterin aldolase [Raphidocelis subcapitata]|uniref:7,8-dihydroneopterin aldolase n=1 Tax=Raphidocelis subcapitata TaxID=307507 RepID=A0A2V0NMH3_9CHLO|nr:dihydroneopterin aldolase [Raphidocelis subcapitata]|eukprot:GBF88339.1 dihydroneopterin aldolase [Raphidocelis subcapitata]